MAITLGVVQVLHDKPIALAQPHTTTFSDTITLFNDLSIELGIGGEGDVFLLYGGVYDELFGLLELISMQGNREGK